MKKISSKQQMIADLEIIFEKALSAENFTVALKAKELLAKVHGFFEKRAPLKPLKEWSEEELASLIEELENE